MRLVPDAARMAPKSASSRVWNEMTARNPRDLVAVVGGLVVVAHEQRDDLSALADGAVECCPLVVGEVDGGDHSRVEELWVGVVEEGFDAEGLRPRARFGQSLYVDGCPFVALVEPPRPPHLHVLRRQSQHVLVQGAVEPKSDVSDPCSRVAAPSPCPSSLPGASHRAVPLRRAAHEARGLGG